MKAKMFNNDTFIEGDLYKDKNCDKWWIYTKPFRLNYYGHRIPYSYIIQVDRNAIVYETFDCILALRRRNPWFHWQILMKYKTEDTPYRKMKVDKLVRVI